jgi:hypothetical protein
MKNYIEKYRKVNYLIKVHPAGAGMSGDGPKILSERARLKDRGVEPVHLT